MSECMFCRIVGGESGAHIVWQDDEHVAFLSHRPNTVGVVVVATRLHVGSYAFVAPPVVLSKLISASANVGRVLDAALTDVGRTGLILEGFGVDHLHSKLYPMHGTSSSEWSARHSNRSEYFEMYEGFISSHDAAPADPGSLASLAEHIRKVTKEIDFHA